jgi:hypothetical protein
MLRCRTYHGVQRSGATWRHPWRGTRNAELQVILPMIACFSMVEMALLLPSYGTLWVSFGVTRAFFFRVVSHCWALGMSTSCHLVQSLQMNNLYNEYKRLTYIERHSLIVSGIFLCRWQTKEASFYCNFTNRLWAKYCFKE